MEISEVGSATIGATSVRLVEPDQARQNISIVNTSAGGQLISITFSNVQQAEAGKGFVLQPSQQIIDSNSEGYSCWKGTIHVISSAAGGTIGYYIR